MITAVSHLADGKKLILLGITYGNVMQLQRDRPIDVNAESHPGFPEDIRICIFYKDTMTELTEVLKELMSDTTQLIVVPKADPNKPPSVS